jgi:GTPase SAR1 family protein
VSSPYYSIFTAAGNRALFGGSRPAVVCPEVSGLRLTDVPEGVQLEWVWPAECTAVRIVRRLGDWPAGPNDPGAVAVSTLSKLEYQEAGDKFIDGIHQRGGHFCYVVYTQVSAGREILFSSGDGPGCREEIELGRSMLLRYRLLPAAFWKRWSRELRLEWDVEDPLAELGGLVLVANQQHPPANVSDGVEIFRWKPAEEDAGKKHVQPVSLEPVRRQGWAKCFCRAFTADAQQSRQVFIVHPDVCTSWSSQGRSPQAAKRKPPGYYRPGVPKTVICPKCFGAFPLAEMNFADAKGNMVAGRYGFLDRVLRRPLRPPRDAHGGNCTVKLCPKKHQLPFNTGTQNSLVIGLIGARSSGKSHYIASLIDRLQGPVGNDMQLGLMPVTDETADRYRVEFHEPLFVRHLQLPATPRLPPPLIYELSIDGALWGQKRSRSVTLALYDTAGEDLNDPQVVRQMLLYIPVASGILLLADPLQMPGVRQLLPASSLPPPLKDADPHPILERVIPELEHRRLATRAGKHAVPLAVVLTKCDALREAGLIERDRVWHTNMRHIGYFNRQIHGDMHGMMGECLQRWSNPVYTTVASRFARHAFFGVSATGCAPDPRTQRFPHVSPRRVEDPLLWLLAELGVIPSG